MQHKQVTSGPKKARAARATTPISLSDTEKGDPEAATIKSTKPRKPRTKPTGLKVGLKPKRRTKEDPDGEFSSAGIPKSARKDSEATTKITASTIPTILTPTSSPPHEGEAVDGGDLVDPNEGRRKRRKKTPISVQMSNSEEDFNSDFLPPPSAQAEVFTSDIDGSGFLQDFDPRQLAIRECPEPKLDVGMLGTEELPSAPPKPNAFGLLMNKNKKNKKDEVVMMVDEPELPPNLPESLVEAPQGRRTPVSFDSSTGILTIRSSPELLPLLVPPSALNLLGKKKQERKRRKKKEAEIPELSLTELSLLEVSKKTVPKKTTAKFDHETGIVTVRSSPVLGPQSPKLKPNAFSILGKKKEMHPPPVQAQVLPPPDLLPTITIRQSPVKVAAGGPKKTVHPFFQPGGLKKVPGTSPLSTAEGKFDAEDIYRTSTQPKNPLSGSNLGTGNGSWFGSGGRLGSTLSNQVLRSPGLADAPWPSRDNCHARGLPASIPPLFTDLDEFFKTERKLKDKAVAVSADEDLLLQYSRKLLIQRQKQEILAPDYNVTRYYNTPGDVRLPERIVMTGSKLQEIVQKRVSARLPHPDAISRRAQPTSDSDSESAVRRKVHPALLKLYNRIQHELTPFDKGECEPLSWGVKYAPESSQEVMQIGKETQILKEWLMALKVESVGISSDNKSGKRKSRSSTPSNAGSKGGVAKKKRKKKKDDELADFIINSDEERDEMGEVTDPEENDWISAPSGTKKSTIRAGDKGIESPFGGLKESVRLVNAVVISGPNGCGKTAAVYAVAKEVGFTVFEVSPGMKRSGKDILDQVGEMSRTHLVHQAKATPEAATSFFRPKTVQKLKAEEDALPKVAPGQQQSLILLEEVDLLFEEDKQFWSTVLTLMAQSKRPIVLTCNDENLLPLNTLPLHAILRFTPPPRELVVDQLLLVCANEGHLLQRDAVESLVKSHNGDIRASLVELEFWCRMGVGDRKGGMDWMIVRWPIGIDIADNGEALRVVSKDTYIKGMGFTDRTPKEEEDKWRCAWETWEVDVGGEDNSMRKLKWSTGATQGEQMDRMAALRICDEYTEAMSAVDCYAGGSMVGFDEVESLMSFQTLVRLLIINRRFRISHNPHSAIKLGLMTCRGTQYCRQIRWLKHILSGWEWRLQSGCWRGGVFATRRGVTSLRRKSSWTSSPSGPGSSKNLSIFT